MSWAALQGQFGADHKDAKGWRRLFKQALRQAVTVYPDAKVEQVGGGLLLKRSTPAIRRKVYGAALSKRSP